MLPFVCRRNIRNLSSTLKFSAKVARRRLGAQARGKSLQAICVAESRDGKWMNCRVENALNKNETRLFSTFQNNMPSICSLVTLLSDGSNVVSVEASGEDDDVTTSAGKKRKHWKIHIREG